METPDVTKAQIIALVQGLLAILAVFGFNLTSSQQGQLLTLAGAVFVVLVTADALIRRGRAKIEAARVNAAGGNPLGGNPLAQLLGAFTAPGPPAPPTPAPSSTGRQVPPPAAPAPPAPGE